MKVELELGRTRGLAAGIQRQNDLQVARALIEYPRAHHSIRYQQEKRHYHTAEPVAVVATATAFAFATETIQQHSPLPQQQQQPE
jgi:hypothetical protein